MRIRDLAILRSAGAGMWGNALQSANASRAAGAQKYAGPAGRKDSELMKAYAQDVERLASEQGILLDDTEESLERVDLLLHKIAGDTVLTPKMPEEASQLWGVGQDIRRISRRGRDSQHERAWELQHNPDGTARVVLDCEGARMFPSDKVYNRLTEDPFSNVSGHCRALRAIINLHRQ